MRYLKNIKSFFSKKKKDGDFLYKDPLYKKISNQEKISFLDTHTWIRFSDKEKKDITEISKYRINGEFTRIVTYLFEIIKFDDEWYTFEVVSHFRTDYSDCFLCDTWDGVKQLLVQFVKPE